MTDTDLKDVTQTAIAVLGSLGGVVVFAFSVRRRNDGLVKQLHELHAEFWTQTSHAQVRKWIANPNAYEAKLKRILAIRNRDRASVRAKDYGTIDKLDRFLNLLRRAYNIRRQAWWPLDPVWDRLLLEFWLDEIRGHSKEPFERAELMHYVKTHFADLLEGDHRAIWFRGIDHIAHSLRRERPKFQQRVFGG